jgi:hypothetical protein
MWQYTYVILSTQEADAGGLQFWGSLGSCLKNKPEELPLTRIATLFLLNLIKCMG